LADYLIMEITTIVTNCQKNIAGDERSTQLPEGMMDEASKFKQ
jgi:hypothetical protein